ncbi:MAG: radical SAM protein [Candidatus Latescibacterota bacterium]
MPQTVLLPPTLRLEFPLPGGTRCLLNVKERAISLSLGTSQVLTFDREGRPYAAFLDGVNYRRGLNGRILHKHNEGEEDGAQGRRRRFLDAGEADALLARLRRCVGWAAAGLDGMPLPEAQAGGGRAWFARLRRWGPAELLADVRHFHQVYRAVSILPPDQYMALVVQSTEGCPWNRCTFCDLYRDRPYRVKSPRELEDHLRAIRDLLGEGIRMRRSVFLGDANMLAVPAERLLETLAGVRRALVDSGGPEGPFFGFTDVFGTRRHDAASLRALQEEGLQRLYVGLETGSEDLLRLLGKPGSGAEAVAGVRALREAGIAAGVIVLLGLGGRERAAEHEAQTVRALNAMDLGSGDMIYYSPLVEHAQGEYARQAALHGFTTMTSAQMRAQRRRIQDGLRFAGARPFASIYDIRDFVY